MKSFYSWLKLPHILVHTKVTQYVVLDDNRPNHMVYDVHIHYQSSDTPWLCTQVIWRHEEKEAVSEWGNEEALIIDKLGVLS